MDNFNLERFVIAQDPTFQRARRELREGMKRSHWMWYIFPQLRGLGHNVISVFYGISGIDEASAYIQHSVLNSRLREVCEVILNLPTDNPIEVFGGIDSKKLRSSMTLFNLVSPKDIFAQVLDKFFDGQRDSRTLTMIDDLEVAK